MALNADLSDATISFLADGEEAALVKYPRGGASRVEPAAYTPEPPQFCDSVRPSDAGTLNDGASGCSSDDGSVASLGEPSLIDVAGERLLSYGVPTEFFLQVKAAAPPGFAARFGRAGREPSLDEYLLGCYVDRVLDLYADQVALLDDGGTKSGPNEASAFPHGRRRAQQQPRGRRRR